MEQMTSENEFEKEEESQESLIQKLVLAIERKKGGKVAEDKVFINEDITEPRRRITEFIKESGLVEYCFIREGTIVCKQGTRFIHVQNADDLFQLGVNRLQYEDYYPSLE